MLLPERHYQWPGTNNVCEQMPHAQVSQVGQLHGQSCCSVPAGPGGSPSRPHGPSRGPAAASGAVAHAVGREQCVQRVVGVAQQRGGARELLVQHRAGLAVHRAPQVVGQLKRVLDAHLQREQRGWDGEGRGRAVMDLTASGRQAGTFREATSVLCAPTLPRLPCLAREAGRPAVSTARTQLPDAPPTRWRSLPMRRVQSLSSLCRQAPSRMDTTSPL